MNINKEKIKIGDIIFIEIPFPPFTKISEATNNWTNHVGVVYDIVDNQIYIAESKVPKVVITKLENFIKRSKNNKYEIYRVKDLTLDEEYKIKSNAKKYLNIKYDYGFNYDSNKQYCSKFVYTIYKESLNIEVGSIETLKEILEKNKNISLCFWNFWFLYSIPWERKAITPANIIENKKLKKII